MIQCHNVLKKPSPNLLFTLTCLTLWHAGLSLAQPPTPSNSSYHWSRSIAVTPAKPGQQSGETALATDTHGVVWLGFIEADYHQLPNQKWVDWPRHIVLLTSRDQGSHFADLLVLGDLGGDEALATDDHGNVVASWIQYSYDDHHQLRQRPVFETVSGERSDTGPVPSINWNLGEKYDQSSVHIGDDGTIHVLATDITPPVPHSQPVYLATGHLQVHYAQSHDGGHTFVAQQRLGIVGELPQIAATHSGLFIVGPAGYLVSHDNGISFEPTYTHRFADKLTRVAVSPDRRRLYVVGDSGTGGLWIQNTQDGGKTWQTTRVDTASHASAWRYPAIHIDSHGRIHVVWMDDRDGQGAIYHAYSDDSGASFSVNSRVSDQPFPFPSDAPPPAPANQRGTWVGDYLSLTSVTGKIVVAWSDQRTGPTQSTVYTAVGAIR
jgi:hypothetical protein